MLPGAYIVGDITNDDIESYSKKFGTYLVCTYRNCKQTFFEPNALKQHLVQHFNDASIDEMVRQHYTDGVMYYDCVQCDYSSSRKINVRRHVMIHLNIKAHQCPHCPYKSNQKSNLEGHISRRHWTADMDNWKHKCPHCSYKSGGRTSLLIHISKQHPVPDYE